MAAPGPCTCHDRRCASNLPRHRCWQKANDGRLSAWQPKQNRIAFVLQPGSGRSEEGQSGRYTRELPWNLIWASSEALAVGERRFWDNCVAESEGCLKEGIFHYSTRVTSNFLPPSSAWMAGAEHMRDLPVSRPQGSLKCWRGARSHAAWWAWGCVKKDISLPIRGCSALWLHNVFILQASDL